MNTFFHFLNYVVCFLCLTMSTGMKSHVPVECRDFLSCSNGTFVMVPNILDNDWIYRMFSFVKVGDHSQFYLPKNYVVDKMVDMWSIEGARLQMLRQSTTTITNIQYSGINRHEEFTQCLTNSAQNVSLGEIYFISKYASWDTYVWNQNVCVRTFQHSTNHVDVVHFVWNTETWSIYIPTVHLSQHMSSNKSAMKSLKRKRNGRCKMFCKVQDQVFRIGESTCDNNPFFSKMMSSPIGTDHTTTIPQNVIDITKAFMEQFDMIPIISEIDTQLPSLNHGIVPYYQNENDLTKIKYKFCHIMKWSPCYNRMFVVNDIDDIETANWCRDHFMEYVYGSDTFKPNDTHSHQIVRDPKLLEELERIMVIALSILGSNSYTVHEHVN